MKAEQQPTKLRPTLRVAWVVVIVAVAGCSRGINVTVGNSTGQTVRNVTVQCGGAAEKIGDIASGQRMTAVLQPTAACAVKIAFTAPSGTSSVADLNIYAEQGYSGDVDAAITPAFKVVVTRGDVAVR